MGNYCIQTFFPNLMSHCTWGKRHNLSLSLSGWWESSVMPPFEAMLLCHSLSVDEQHHVGDGKPKITRLQMPLVPSPQHFDLMRSCPLLKCFVKVSWILTQFTNKEGSANDSPKAWHLPNGIIYFIWLRVEESSLSFLLLLYLTAVRKCQAPGTCGKIVVVILNWPKMKIINHNANACKSVIVKGCIPFSTHLQELFITFW